MARALISKNATKSVYRDGDKAVKVFCKGFPKAEVLNEALISARVEAIGGINIPSVQAVSVEEDGCWSITRDYIEGKTLTEIISMLNKESGVYGISGKSSDFRDLNKGIAEGDKRCEIAMNVFTYQAAKFIGGYVAAMNGVDAIVFTAGVGENDPKVRKDTCSHLGYLGVEIDDEANKLRGEEVKISTENSKVPVYVVPTNEELAIARETVALAK